MSTWKTLRSQKKTSMTRGIENRYQNKVDMIDRFYKSGLKVDIN